MDGHRRTPEGASTSSGVRCKGCHELIDEADNFCRYCGKARVGGEAWYYRPRWILILTFTALGPFALILVWKSPKISLRDKALLATVIIAATITALGLLYLIVMWFSSVHRMIKELNQELDYYR